MKERIDFLDGMRGLAILLVIGFHAYSRWPEHVPYSDQYADIFLFKYGWLGVQLFFLISGFVIFMSLERSRNFLHFIKKRWLRLFPAMLFVSLLVYFTLPLFIEGPTKTLSPIDFLPGLTFIEHTWWEALLQTPIRSIEGPYWTLYVEFRFYVIAALIFFFLGKRYLVPILTLLYLVGLFSTVSHHLPQNDFFIYLKKMSEVMSFGHFGWFAAGTAFYLYFSTKEKKWFYAGWAIGLLSVLILRDTKTIVPMLYGLTLLAIFSGSLVLPWIQALLRSKLLLLFGFVSYPLYLMHENALVALVVKFGEHMPSVPSFAYPILAIALIVPAAYLIAKSVEPTLKRLFQNILDGGLKTVFSRAKSEI